MNKEQAEKLIPEKSYVGFAGGKYRFAHFANRFGVLFLGIYDEPPSQHIDYIKAGSCEWVDPSHPEQGEQGELYKWVKDAIDSYVYKWPSEIQDAMRKDIQFGYDLGYKEFLGLIIESNEVLRSCYQVAARGGNETNWPALTSRIENILEKQHKAIYMPGSKADSPPEGQDEIKRLKDLIEKLYKGSMKFAAGLWDDTDIATEWDLFKQENNL